MRGLRALAVAAVTASTVALGGAPAEAATAVTFEGDAYIDCFGCGASAGEATLWVGGVYDDEVVVPAVYGVTPPNAHAWFDVDEPPSTCPLTGTATGSFSVLTTGGWRSGSFDWTRVATQAVVTVNGSAAAGPATFVVTAPAGIACGQPDVVAHVTGSVGGA
jgi:hypothetical protein